MLGSLTNEQIIKFLGSQSVGRIGCHAKGRTYVVPINYVAQADTIYCHSEEGMKIDLMRTNPEVCFQIDEIQNAGDWVSVIGWGRFEELAGEERNRALELLMSNPRQLLPSHTQKSNPEWPYGSGSTDMQGIVFKISLNELHGRYEKIRSSPKIA